MPFIKANRLRLSGKIVAKSSSDNVYINLIKFNTKMTLVVRQIANQVHYEAVLSCVQEKMHPLISSQVDMTCFYHKIFTVSSSSTNPFNSLHRR